MDLNIIRSVVTVVLFFAFIGIVLWAWSRPRKRMFDEAAHLPFADDEINQRSVQAADTKADKENP